MLRPEAPREWTMWSQTLFPRYRRGCAWWQLHERKRGRRVGSARQSTLCFIILQLSESSFTHRHGVAQSLPLHCPLSRCPPWSLVFCLLVLLGSLSVVSWSTLVTLASVFRGPLPFHFNSSHFLFQSSSWVPFLFFSPPDARGKCLWGHHCVAILLLRVAPHMRAGLWRSISVIVFWGLSVGESRASAS